MTSAPRRRAPGHPRRARHRPCRGGHGDARPRGSCAPTCWPTSGWSTRCAPTWSSTCGTRWPSWPPGHAPSRSPRSSRPTHTRRPAASGGRTPRPRPGLPDPVPVVNAVAAEVGCPPSTQVAEWCVGDVALVTGTPRTDPLPGRGRHDVRRRAALGAARPTGCPCRPAAAGGPAGGVGLLRQPVVRPGRPLDGLAGGPGGLRGGARRAGAHGAAHHRTSRAAEAPAAAAGRVPTTSGGCRGCRWPHAATCSCTTGATAAARPASGPAPRRWSCRRSPSGRATPAAGRAAGRGSWFRSPRGPTTSRRSTSTSCAAPSAGCSTTRAMPPGSRGRGGPADLRRSGRRRRPRRGAGRGPLTAVGSSRRRFGRPPADVRLTPAARVLLPWGPGGPSLASKP